MSLFDLLFIVVFLGTVAILVTVLVAVIRGRSTQALRILRILAISLAAYFVVGIAVDFAKPQREIRVGDPWCFDDWCLAVEGVNRAPAGANVNYDVHLRIFTRARRAAQRAKGAWIYLIDDHGRRYAPNTDASAVPLDVLLLPGESVATSRVFSVPSGVENLGLITGHGGPYCGPMNIVIIGAGGCLFGRPMLVRVSVERQIGDRLSALLEQVAPIPYT